MPYVGGAMWVVSATAPHMCGKREKGFLFLFLSVHFIEVQLEKGVAHLMHLFVSSIMHLIPSSHIIFYGPASAALLP